MFLQESPDVCTKLTRHRVIRIPDAMQASLAASLLADGRSIGWYSRHYLLLPDQSSINTVPSTNAAVVTLLSERDAELILLSDKPSYLDSGVARIESLFESE